jgi:hypothetical protein
VCLRSLDELPAGVDLHTGLAPELQFCAAMRDTLLVSSFLVFTLAAPRLAAGQSSDAAPVAPPAGAVAEPVITAPAPAEQISPPTSTAASAASPAPSPASGSARAPSSLRRSAAMGGEAPPLQMALATNFPAIWPHSIAGSLYVALSRHQLIRANFAYHENLGVLLPVEDETSHEGSITDLGVGWSWYPRRNWSSLSLEVGPLLRIRDTTDSPEYDLSVRRDTTTVAGRGLVGWSWMLGSHVFIAAAVGMSVGYETGDQTLTPNFDSPSQTIIKSHVRRMQTDPEAYLRFGVALGSSRRHTRSPHAVAVAAR